MNRRGFLGAILAAAVAPAIVRADALMRIVPRATTIIPAAEELVVMPGLYRGMIGEYSGITIHQARDMVDIMRSREIKPDKNGSYWISLPRNNWLELK